MSQVILATFVNLAVTLFPLIGIQVGGDDLTKTIQVITAIVTGVWIWIRRVKQGDVSVLGMRKV